MSTPYRTTRRVEWHETDAAGIAHFTAFFRYMEEVEHEFLRHLGLSVLSRTGAEKLSWPRVAVRCDYHGPVEFEDQLTVELTVTRVGSKSVTYEFVFSHGERHVAVGSATAVCCRIVSGQPPLAVPIPDEVTALLRRDFPEAAPER